MVAVTDPFKMRIFRRKHSVSFWKPFSSCQDIFSVYLAVFEDEKFMKFMLPTGIDDSKSLWRKTAHYLGSLVRPNSPSARFLGTFFPLSSSALMNAITPSPVSFSPILPHMLLYSLTAACIQSHSCTCIQRDPQDLCTWPIRHSGGLKIQPRCATALWSLVECVFKVRPTTCENSHKHSHDMFLQARHHCAHTGSMILGQKVVRPLKCSLNPVLSFSTTPFFPILHGTYPGRAIKV